MAYREKDTKKWTAQWFETNVMGEKKKRRKRGFETKREALEFERSKKLSNERSMNMKLSDFIEIYFSDKQNDLKDRTIKNKRYMMQQHIVPYFGNQMMSEIKASQIIQWQNEIQKKGYSDSYLRMIQNQLTSLFTHAAKIYDLPVNPCKKVKRMGNSDSRSLNFWTLDEYKCKLRLNGTPVPLVRNGYSIFNGTKYRQVTSFCFTHIYTVHLQTIRMVLIGDTCKARISVGIISKHIEPCTDWKLRDNYS